MPTITLDIKVNNNIVRTITLDDYVANGYNTSSFTKTELTDRDRVKQISMTEWINIQSFVKKNKIHLNDTESGVFGFIYQRRYRDSKTSNSADDCVKQGSKSQLYTNTLILACADWL